jgi:poly-gamma-glutamate synthesis protein (capsule biosynthesis protein)
MVCKKDAVQTFQRQLYGARLCYEINAIFFFLYSLYQSVKLTANNFRAMKRAGFDVVSLANDNIERLSAPEVGDTREALGEVGLSTVGANEYDIYEPKIMRVGSTKIAFIAISDIAGVGDSNVLIDESKMSEAIAEARKESGLVVVSIHFGNKYETKPTERQRSLAELAIDSGADLVVGHFAHVVQPLEKYKNGYVAYGLGNFVYDQAFSEETMKGSLLEVKVSDGTIQNAVLTSVSLNENFQPVVSSR